MEFPAQCFEDRKRGDNRQKYLHLNDQLNTSRFCIKGEEGVDGQERAHGHPIDCRILAAIGRQSMAFRLIEAG